MNKTIAWDPTRRLLAVLLKLSILAILGAPSAQGYNPPSTIPKNPDGTVTQAFWDSIPNFTWVELPGTNFLSAANNLIPTNYNCNDPVTGKSSQGYFIGTNNIDGMVDAYGDPVPDIPNRKVYIYNGGHTNGSNNGMIQFDMAKLTYALTIPPTPSCAYPPGFNNGSNQPGPLIYPSGLGSAYFRSSANLSDSRDLHFAAPQDAPTVTHNYIANAIRNNGVIHMFYANYHEADTVSRSWRHLDDVDLGAQLYAINPNYTSFPLQQGTAAVYDDVTDKFFVTMVPGDQGLNWRHGIFKFDPVTRLIVPGSVVGVGTTESMNLLQAGRDLYGFTYTGNYPGPMSTDQGWKFNIDTGAVTYLKVIGDQATFSYNSATEAIVPFYHPGLHKIIRWNFATEPNAMYVLDTTPTAGSGTSGDPYQLPQTRVAVTPSGATPVGQYCYRRLYYDGSAGVALVLPHADSNWFAIKFGQAQPPTPQSPVVNSATSAPGVVAAPFTYQITATNSPTSFGASGLPAGLTLDGANGLISGTPVAEGVSNVTISATNAAGAGTSSLRLSFGPAAPPPSGSGLVAATISDTRASFSVRSNVPVTFGHVFKPGQFTGGIGVQLAGGAGLQTQVDVKSRYADGSVRHAVITALLSSENSAATAVELYAATQPSPGPPVSASGLLATGYDASVALNIGGTVYSASARDALSAATTTWLSGPLVSEWSFNVPFTAGGQTDPHLMARFNVRAYQGYGYVRTDVTVENDWAYVSGPTNYTYSATVTAPGGASYSISNLTHTTHSRWRKTLWNGSNDPALELKYDKTYLIATGAVPNYDQSVTPSASAIANQFATLNGAAGRPMASGLFTGYMPTTGGRPEIGLLPAHEVLYLLSMDSTARKVVLMNADLAGSWPMHYRDQITDLPLSIDRWPYATLLGNYSDTYNPATRKYEGFPACAGVCSSPLEPDTAHQPAMAYVAYLITGDQYYLDELHFWAAYDIFISNPGYRNFEQGLVHWDQTRGQGWSLRTLAQAAAFTPDAHPYKNYFTTKLLNNINWYRTTYLNNANNSLGVITTGFALGYNDALGIVPGTIGIAPWQDDFFTSAVGHSVELGFTQSLPLLQWKSQFAIGRMTAPGYCWIRASAYSLNIEASASGPFFSTLAQAYSSSFNDQGAACASAQQASNLGLQTGEMVGYSSSSSGYPSNMQPALAYAASNNFAGAGQAWTVFTGRSVKPSYGTEPQFAIVPRSLPATGKAPKSPTRFIFR
jgi:hypothetical protein